MDEASLDGVNRAVKLSLERERRGDGEGRSEDGKELHLGEVAGLVRAGRLEVLENGFGISIGKDSMSVDLVWSRNECSADVVKKLDGEKKKTMYVAAFLYGGFIPTGTETYPVQDAKATRGCTP